MTATPSRRQVLAAAAVGPIAACTAPTPPPPVNPDDARRAAAVLREQGLLAAYDALLAATPALTAKLTGLRAEHTAHLAALGGAPGSTVPSPAVSSQVVTVTQLVAMERGAAAAHAADALTASRLLAPVLASLSASESSHIVALS